MTSDYSRRMTRLLCSSLLGIALVALAPARSEASVIVTIVQSGADVLASGSGTLNITALTPGSPGSLAVGGENGTFAAVRLGATPGTQLPVDPYLGTSGPTSFGTIAGFVIANSGTGSRFGVTGTSNQIEVPGGYISGSALSGTATFTNTTLAGLGLTSGTYIWTWGEGRTADSFTVQIGNAVPEPGTVVSLSLGLALLATMRRRRQSLRDTN